MAVLCDLLTQSVAPLVFANPTVLNFDLNDPLWSRLRRSGMMANRLRLGRPSNRQEGRVDFYEVVDQVVDLLQRRKRVAYRALKRQFDFDDDDIEALKDELIDAQGVAVGEAGKVLVWAGGTSTTAESTVPNGKSHRPSSTRNRLVPRF